MRSVLVRCYHRHNILANTTSIVDMASIFNAINGLRNEIKDVKEEMKSEFLEIKKDINYMKEDINYMKNDINEVKKDINDMKIDMKKDISKLNLKVDQTRVLSGSLVEANIRNYFTREYGESFSRHYVASDLSGLIYLATPRELRKSSDGYHVFSSEEQIL